MNIAKEIEALESLARDVDPNDAYISGRNFSETAAEIRRVIAALRQKVEGAAGPIDYVPGELDRTAPERIWLQIDTGGDNAERDEPWPGADGVTWQDEEIGGLEIQYIRADLAAPAAPAAKHWHDLYRAECRLRQDAAAHYGQQILDLEAAAAPAAVVDEAKLANLHGVRRFSIDGKTGCEHQGWAFSPEQLSAFVAALSGKQGGAE